MAEYLKRYWAKKVSPPNERQTVCQTWRWVSMILPVQSTVSVSGEVWIVDRSDEMFEIRSPAMSRCAFKTLTEEVAGSKVSRVALVRSFEDILT